jgi:hypothetical protein
MTGPKIWRINVRRIGESESRFAERRTMLREPVKDETIDVAIDGENIRTRIGTYSSPRTGLAGEYVVEAVEVES